MPCSCGLALKCKASRTLFSRARGRDADWDNARRADSYRCSIFNNATNAKLQEKLVEDSDATFAGLPTGIPLRVEVTALNAAGESQPVTLLITLTA